MTMKQESSSLPGRIEAEIPLSLVVMDRLPVGRATFEYAVLMDRGIEFPAIRLARRSDGRFQIRDGRHRYLAAKLIGRNSILARFSLRVMTPENGGE